MTTPNIDKLKEAEKTSSLADSILKEASLKLDFAKGEFQIGWFWVLCSIISCYPDFSMMIDNPFISLPIALALVIYTFFTRKS